MFLDIDYWLRYVIIITKKDWEAHMVVLLAGGAGYIGSHTAVELLNAGHDVVIVDDYSNSCPESIKRVEEITGKSIVSYEADVKDKEAMTKIFADNKIDCVIHFAGLKAVGESTRLPAKYYRNNIDTTLTLLECMKEAGVKKIVFSSSATVYGEQKPPYVETMPRGACSNPYGWTKAMMEQILTDCANADSELTVILLRYFNPIGAHPSGMYHRLRQEEESSLQYLAEITIHQMVLVEEIIYTLWTLPVDILRLLNMHSHIRVLRYLT